MATRKGPVSIEVVGTRIRLRWKVSGQPVSLAIGAADCPLARIKAEQVALQIAVDLMAEPTTYDVSLLRYKAMIDPHAALISSVGVLDLFDRFFKYRSTDLERNSKAKWEAVRKHLAALSHKKAAQVDERLCQLFFSGLGHLSVDTRRSYLAILRACWGYGGLRYGLKSNPWELIRLPRAERSEPDPFTLAEVQRILAGFADSHYRPFVCGLLSLGCRPGEAAALTWADVDWDTNTVSINKSWDGEAVKSTKTRKIRAVPMVASLRTILSAHRPSDWQPTDLIFTAPKGGFINTRVFLRQHWKPTLVRMGVRYRSVYKCRHTVWSHAILTMPIAEAAQNAGNLPSTLLANYVGSVSASPMPDLLQSLNPEIE
jgi:integrase